MRNYNTVINDIIKVVPSKETDFISALNKLIERHAYKAPEDATKWDDAMENLMHFIPSPKKKWQYMAISVFTDKPIDEVKKSFRQ